jgi:hypothetical protein
MKMSAAISQYLKQLIVCGLYVIFIVSFHGNISLMRYQTKVPSQFITCTTILGRKCNGTVIFI